MANHRKTGKHAASEAFFDGYVECALWSSTDESTDSGGDPLDDNYGPDDITVKTRKEMRADCDAFVKECRHRLATSGLSDSRAGHDFWLSRNGHGSGFWDEGLGKVGDSLHAAAKVYGTYDLYVSRGKVHGS